VSTFKKTPKYQIEAIRKKIQDKYKDLSELHLIDIFKKTEAEYNELHKYYGKDEEQREHLESLRDSIYELSKTKNEIVQKIRNDFFAKKKDAHSKLSFFERLRVPHEQVRQESNLKEFNQRIISQEEIDLDNQINKLRSQRNSFVEIDYSDLISRRKHLYHELAVIKKMLGEFRKENAKALLNGVLKKNRLRSSTLKKQEKSKLEFNSFCPYCSEPIVKNELVLDHIFPVAKGGQSTAQNTILVCFSCNSKKSDKTLRQFCKLNQLDYEEICNKLEQLGKVI